MSGASGKRIREAWRMAWRAVLGFLRIRPLHVCSCCGRKTFAWRSIEPHVYGIQRDLHDRPALILWLCPGCRSTKAVLWEEASARLRLFSYDASPDAVAAWRRLRRPMKEAQ